MKPLPVILIGAGGHAKELLDALDLLGMEVIGLTDLDASRAGQQVSGVPIIGGDEVPSLHKPGSIQLVNAIGSIGSMSARRAAYEKFSKQGFTFADVIHPAAMVSRRAILQAGVQIMAGSIVQADATIALNTIINAGAIVEHDCFVGAHVHLAPGVTLSGAVRIGEATHVGTGATIIQSIQVGKGCTIAAGAVVIGNVPDGATVSGVPAKGAISS